jgi:CMP-N,N'-diacetyllegionaminic acid synthase
VAEPSAIALIPARAGSVRVRDKNIRPLAGHPAMAYAIAAARASGVFGAVAVSTDSEAYGEIARWYGAEIIARPAAIAGARSPDIQWVSHALETLAGQGRGADVFSILRITSPFRKAATIRRAWDVFRAAEGADSLRAVERVSQHPGKMWRLDGGRIRPLLDQPADAQPWHSRQMADLPEVYVQNASLEMAWTKMALATGTIAGTDIVPFFTEGDEGVDINTEQDWWWAERLIANGEAQLPEVDTAPWRSDGAIG